jgi:cytoskeletal protein CcmA (bactofilin family)
MEPPRPNDPIGVDRAHIGRSVVIKGELSGNEDLFVDGEVEGSIELHGHSIVIGPNARVHASVNAKDVVVQGKVQGNVRATDRVELRKSASLTGDISTQRVSIEDGAFFKGAVDVQKAEAKPAAAGTAAGVSSTAKPASATPAMAGATTQGSLLERK